MKSGTAGRKRTPDRRTPLEKACDQFLLSDIGMACQTPQAYDRRYISVRLTRAFEAGWKAGVEAGWKEGRVIKSKGPP